MSESEDEARARKQRMRENAERQDAEDAQQTKVSGPNEARRARVALISYAFAGLGFLLLVVALFVEPEDLFWLKVVVAASQLWPFLIGVAAMGGIIHQALPDD